MCPAAGAAGCQGPGPMTVLPPPLFAGTAKRSWVQTPTDRFMEGECGYSEGEMGCFRGNAGAWIAMGSDRVDPVS